MSSINSKPGVRTQTQVRQTLGKTANALELSIEELEERIAPSMAHPQFGYRLG